MTYWQKQNDRVAEPVLYYFSWLRRVVYYKVTRRVSSSCQRCSLNQRSPVLGFIQKLS